MIKNLKDKRTVLEKDIEEESVDIKNLKEKLQKVSEKSNLYIIHFYFKGNKKEENEVQTGAEGKYQREEITKKTT